MPPKKKPVALAQKKKASQERRRKSHDDEEEEEKGSNASANKMSQATVEVGNEINSIIAELLEDSNAQVKSVHIRQFVSLFKQSYRHFKIPFMKLIDKILTLDARDQLIKGIYKLLERFYQAIAKEPDFQKSDGHILIVQVTTRLLEVYFMQKINSHIQYRAAFMLTQVMTGGIYEQLKLDREASESLFQAILDMLAQPKTTIKIYGIQMGALICDFTKTNNQIHIQLMNLLTHSKTRDVRKAIMNAIPVPYSPISLLFLGKRLRDKDPDMRRLCFVKLTNAKVTLEEFKSQEGRMLLIKEGLTDSYEPVREQCIAFLKQTVLSHPEDLSYIFKLIDCQQMFVKEYYIQLPFLIMSLVMHLIEDEMKLIDYLATLFEKLKIMGGLVDDMPMGADVMKQNQQDATSIMFEEIMFLRISFEYVKMNKRDRSYDFNQALDKLIPEFSDYYSIFNALLKVPNQDRLVFSEWVKFALQMNIEDEVIRRNLVSLMFDYIPKVKYSFMDYQHLLRNKKLVLRERQNKGQGDDVYEYDTDMELSDDEEIENSGEDQVIEIEIRAFQELNRQRDIQEYCKPFSFDCLVIDSDDVCRIAVIVARKLLDNRAEEFSLSMLQAISDIKDPLEEQSSEGTISYKVQKDRLYKRLENKLDDVNTLVTNEDYSFQELNQIMKKVRSYVGLLEEINLREKLSFKRALNLCLILLKQCRADVNDQNLVDICETLIRPTIQSKDKDNFLLAIECIGLLCLLDKELFWNYSKIFQSILTEEVLQDNIREKIIALRSSVDSLIIHGVDAKTQKLQHTIIADYMTIKDKVLRQITIEGICKMLFSRKLTQNAEQQVEMEFLLSQLVIQWFDRRFNWQNSLVRQILNVFFKSFVLFSSQRCKVMLQALIKVIFCILESKYGDLKRKQYMKQKNNNNNNNHNVKSNAKGQKGSFYMGQKSNNNSHNKRVRRYSANDSNEDSAFSGSDVDDFMSDDSQFATKQAKMEDICGELDAVQISKVFMLLLSKAYINSNAPKEFHISQDYNLQFLCTFAHLNVQKFKKVAIVKEFLSPLLDYVDVTQCVDITLLRQVGDLIKQNSKMLVGNNVKLNKFVEQTEKRIKIIEQQKQEDQGEDLVDKIMGGAEENKNDENQDEVNDQDQAEGRQVDGLDIDIEALDTFYTDEILGTIVDLVVDNDDEYQELQQEQHKKAKSLLSTPFNSQQQHQRPSILQSNNVKNEGSHQEQKQGGSKRRSGLRQRRRFQNGGASGNLSSIREQEDGRGGGSSDEEDMEESDEKDQRPRRNNKNCETILEGKEELSLEDISNSSFSGAYGSNINDSQSYSQKDNVARKSLQLQQLQQEKKDRAGLMSKLSKKMVRDFTDNKKKSIQSGLAPLTQSINEQRMKEEYNDGRTVFKISKNKSISPQQEGQVSRLGPLGRPIGASEFMANQNNLGGVPYNRQTYTNNPNYAKFMADQQNAQASQANQNNPSNMRKSRDRLAHNLSVTFDKMSIIDHESGSENDAAKRRSSNGSQSFRNSGISNNILNGSLSYAKYNDKGNMSMAQFRSGAKGNEGGGPNNKNDNPLFMDLSFDGRKPTVQTRSQRKQNALSKSIISKTSGSGSDDDSSEGSSSDDEEKTNEDKEIFNFMKTKEKKQQAVPHQQKPVAKGASKSNNVSRSRAAVAESSHQNNELRSIKNIQQRETINTSVGGRVGNVTKKMHGDKENNKSKNDTRGRNNSKSNGDGAANNKSSRSVKR